MEICFKDAEVDRPVYDYGVKQEWEKHVFYECPAKVSEAELKAALRERGLLDERRLESLGRQSGGWIAGALLLAMQGKIGHYLRENEWLMTIKNRAAIPGGVCEFDLPGYHYWRHRDPALRQQDLRGWIAPMMPTSGANTPMVAQRTSSKVASGGNRQA